MMDKKNIGLIIGLVIGIFIFMNIQNQPQSISPTNQTIESNIKFFSNSLQGTITSNTLSACESNQENDEDDGYEICKPCFKMTQTIANCAATYGQDQYLDNVDDYTYVYAEISYGGCVGDLDQQQKDVLNNCFKTNNPKTCPTGKTLCTDTGACQTSCSCIDTAYKVTEVDSGCTFAGKKECQSSTTYQICSIYGEWESGGTCSGGCLNGVLSNGDWYHYCSEDKLCSGSPTCTKTCSSEGFECGTHTICGVSKSCGSCGTGYKCSSGSCISSSTTCPEGQTQCNDGSCAVTCGSNPPPDEATLCPNTGEEKQFWEEIKNNKCQTAMWIWIAGGVIGLLIVLSLVGKKR